MVLDMTSEQAHTQIYFPTMAAEHSERGRCEVDLILSGSQKSFPVLPLEETSSRWELSADLESGSIENDCQR